MTTDVEWTETHLALSRKDDQIYFNMSRDEDESLKCERPSAAL